MTREEQIEKAAKRYVKDIVTPIPASLKVAFAAGVKWADKHPDNPFVGVLAHMSSNAYKVWLDKACEFLKSYRQETPDGMGYIAGIVNDETIEDFRKYMEEQQ